MDKNITIKIMNEFFEAFNLNPNKLAVEIGMRAPSIYDVVSPRKENVGISKKLAKKISEKFPVNEDYFLTGNGNMLKSEQIEPITLNEPQAEYITISREILDILKIQSETILSQQRTIENINKLLTDKN